jgi:hypothetical protein
VFLVSTLCILGSLVLLIVCIRSAVRYGFWYWPLITIGVFWIVWPLLLMERERRKHKP